MDLDSFVISAVMLLAAASVAVAVFKRLGLGSVLGLLVAGVIVGPHSPGPYVTAHVHVDDVRHFTELGVVLLLFVIGLEMRPRRLWALRREVFGLGSLQILLSGIAIAAYAGLHQASWKTALLIGLTFALSSTAFVVQLLQERGEIASRHGTTAFAVLLMQDLAIVPLLALVPILSDTGTLSADIPLWEQIAIVLAMFGLVWAFGRYVVPYALNTLPRVPIIARAQDLEACGHLINAGVTGLSRGRGEQPAPARRGHADVRCARGQCRPAAARGAQQKLCLGAHPGDGRDRPLKLSPPRTGGRTLYSSCLSRIHFFLMFHDVNAAL